MSDPFPPALYLCPTPIGNLLDITLRGLDLLRRADLILAEDTRRTGILLKRHGVVAARLVSYHKFNERERLPEISAAIREGKVVALVTDAGTPGLSDPGEIVVHHLIEEGLPVAALPGPQALLPALTLSGLPTSPFSFMGFLPRSGRSRTEAIAQIAARPDTLVLFESARRIADTLADLRQALGDRRACMARELTKLHESLERGTLSSLEGTVRAVAPRGECVLIIEGATGNSGLQGADMASWVKASLDSGLSPAGVKEAAAKAGFSRNAAYEEALAQSRRTRHRSTNRPH